LSVLRREAYYRYAAFEMAVTADYDAQSAVERELGPEACKPAMATASRDSHYAQ